MTARPAHFSTETPALALVWDASALKELQFCPTRYWRTLVQGWHGSTVDLEFGGFVAKCLECYKKLRIQSWTKEAATLAAVRMALVLTWRDGQPWGGRFEPQWHCLGTESYKNARGNRAKCPYSHKGVWFPEPAPSICGECGSAIEAQMNFISEHRTKNRVSLVRAVVWWCDEQPQEVEAGMHPLVLPDGTPAVELSVLAPLPLTTADGERFMLSGLFDEISFFDGETFVLDNKTTAKFLDEDFFAGYAPNMQVDTYDLLAATALKSMDIKGVIIDAIQVLTNAVRTAKQVFYKTEEQREEHLKLILQLLKQAEGYAKAGEWPMNKANCWLCPFKRICALPASEREGALERSSFTRGEPWSPLTTR